jgi:APA family basic amino acid/polyamine antiporter
VPAADRGVGESVKANVVLTLIELSGPLLVIMVGLWAFTKGHTDFSQVFAFDTPKDKSVFLAVTTATSLAFFAMVGFEDSVNMAEETKDPSKNFPKMMITGLSITGVIYVLVSITAVALVPVADLAASDTPLVLVVKAGAPGLPIDKILPFISVFAVANSALINMMMASRLIYGMAKQKVLPPMLGRVHERRRTPWVAIMFTTGLAFVLVIYLSFASDDAVAVLGGTTSLLLLAVFSVVNVIVLMLRRDKAPSDAFRTPTWLPLIGAVACLYLVTPLSGRPVTQYVVAGALVVLGIVLWAVTAVWLRRTGGQSLSGEDDLIRDIGGDGPVN